VSVRVSRVATVGIAAGSLAALAWIVGFFTALDTVPPPPAVPAGVTAPDNFGLFAEVWSIVDGEFYGERALPREVTYGAIDGVLESLADPYADFVDPESVARAVEAAGPAMATGIGVWFEAGYQGALVVSAVPGSPADRADLRPGDILLAADETSLDGADRATVLDALAGEVGTAVVLSVYRAREAPFPVEVVRDRFAAPVVEARQLGGGVGYLRIASFSPGLDPALQRALADVVSAQSLALVLDLQDNPGGDLDVLRAAASRFVAGTLYVEVRGAERRPIESRRDIAPVALPPVYVLVNEGTASAAEMLAAVLRERLDAKLIGHTTFGKATIQGIVGLSDGSLLRLTVAEWESPKAVTVTDGGLAPDRALESTEDPVEVARAIALQRTAANG
jgi:carboxyl-terminal processing protease